MYEQACLVIPVILLAGGEASDRPIEIVRAAKSGDGGLLIVAEVDCVKVGAAGGCPCPNRRRTR